MQTKNISSPVTQQIFQSIQYHYDNFLEKLNLQTLHPRRCHWRALFLIKVFNVVNVLPQFLKLLVFVFPLGICSVAPPVTVLQIDVLLLVMRFVNRQIFLETCCDIPAERSSEREETAVARERLGKHVMTLLSGSPLRGNGSVNTPTAKQWMS
jgi:hypothetical protein